MSKVTIKVAMELLSHEGVVLRVYRDSKGIKTWGVGVTDASGYKIGRWTGVDSTLEEALRVYIWLLETKYLPGVLRAFNGMTLAEHELAAALSFHYNTGAIETASWVKEVRVGARERAKKSIMNWRKPPEIIGRRARERDLFFSGRWTFDEKVTLYRKVSKEGKPYDTVRVNVRPTLEALLGASPPVLAQPVPVQPSPDPVPLPVTPPLSAWQRFLNWMRSFS